RREGRTAGGAGADDVDDLVLPGGQVGRADVVERLAAGAAGDGEVSGVGAAADGPGVAATQGRQRVAEGDAVGRALALVDHVDREAHLLARVDRGGIGRLGDVHVGAEHGDAGGRGVVLLAAGLVAGFDARRFAQLRREGRTAGGAGADD